MDFFNNLSVNHATAFNLIIGIGIVLLCFILGRILRKFLLKIGNRFSAPEMIVRKVSIIALAKSATLIFIAIGFSVAINISPSNISFFNILNLANQILIIVTIAYTIYNLIEVPGTWFELRLNNTDKTINKVFIPVIRKTLQVTVVIFTIIQVIQTVSDKPITSVFAGLGIAGLAVSLGAQDTLKHFFGSIALIGDKPFNIGDRIVVDGNDGIVERVGLRSTRIRTLDGHLVAYPNGNLVNQPVKNISERPNIKRTFNVTITYDTPLEKIKEAVNILKKLLDNHEGMNPDLPPRVYFNDFNADSLNIQVIYWYHPAAYWDYMEFNENLNLQIFTEFEKAGIEFAFPTQTVFVAGDSKRPLKT